MKIPRSIARAGSLVRPTYFFDARANFLNLHRSCQDIPHGQGFLKPVNWRAAMPKAARISASAPVSSASGRSTSSQFVSIALFSGIGLLISLIAVLLGVEGAWY
jgi:hypothetical protein